MAAITINVPDAVLPRLLDAVAANYNYNAAVDGTRSAFTKKQIGAWARLQVELYEARVATHAAARTVATSVNTDIVIT